MNPQKLPAVLAKKWYYWCKDHHSCWL